MNIGIIPARGGSQGVPRKNIKTMAGKPLIGWAIEAARQSKLLDDFYVSTEDDEIARIAQALGAKVIRRPEELATNTALMLDVLRHIVKETNAENVVLLQPTSPQRDAKLVDACIQKFIDSKADNLATGYECSVYEYGRYPSNRQGMNSFFHNDGAVYIIRAALIENAPPEQSQWGVRLGEKTEFFYTEEEMHYEIDTEFQFWLVEQILKRKLEREMNEPTTKQESLL